MRPLELNVPMLGATASTTQLQDAQQWLDSLSKLDGGHAFEAVLERLQAINRLAFGPALRFTLAESFLGVVEYLAEALCRRCEHLEFPVNEPDQVHSVQIQHLLEEMAVSYKRVLIDLNATAPAAEMLSLLRDAALQALRLLTLRVLQAYTVYQPVLPGVWSELHRLYRYAESINVTTVRVEHLADQSVGDVYRRVLLLALTNPYHLMQGEVRLADEKLGQWALAARIRHPAEFPSEAPQSFYANRCYVDLEADAPPCFGFRPGQMSPRDARILELSPVTQIVEERIRQLMLKGQLAMRERMERDLLRRLRNAWSGRPARAGERLDQQRAVQVVSGLRACHHALTAGAPFQPEHDEVALHGDAFRKGPSLSLVPIEEEPWRREDTRGKLEQGLLKPRGFGFDMERREEDVWELAQRTGSGRSTQLEERQDSKLLQRSGSLRLQDVSAAGVGVRCGRDSPLRFRVGDLVRVVDAAAAQDTDSIGVVCWLRHLDSGELALGFNRIGGRAQGVAVRGVEGSGAASDYHRALDLRSGEPGSGGMRALIVPAGIYDLGSVVLCNSGTVLELLTLKRILRSTKGFTQYAVEVQALDGLWSERVLASLYAMLERATL